MSSSARSSSANLQNRASRVPDEGQYSPSLLPPSMPPLLSHDSWRSSVASARSEVRSYLYAGDSSSAVEFGALAGAGAGDSRRNTFYSIEKADLQPEEDDYLHEAVAPAKILGESRYLIEPRSFQSSAWWSSRGFLNVATVFLLLGGIVAVFMVYPVTSFVFSVEFTNTTGYYSPPPPPPPTTNSTASGVTINPMTDLPLIFKRTGPIDPDTDESVKTKVNFDGVEMELVFSDEFNTDGRTFYPGEDPFFEAVDLHYWETGDLEWYDPGNAITQDGYLQINITEETAANSHGLGYLGSMLQSWNKFCFTGGRIEASLSLPGDPTISGLWPSVWTLSNLGRAGYGATTQGTWPYVYDTCDIGTLPNQTQNGLPAAAKGLSVLPGQKLSSCTCPGEDHPGPVNKDGTFPGRYAAEIDLFEASADATIGGQVSQSAQWAPFSAKYALQNDSLAEGWVDTELSTTNFDTAMNTYVGGTGQQATSGMSRVPASCFNSATNFCTFGFEYTPSDFVPAGDYGNITWISDGQPTWRIDARAMGADAATGISAHPVTNEPQSIVINLGVSNSFSPLSADMTYPNYMRIDYIRIYQPVGAGMGVSCSPKNYPTEDYISRHMEAYTNPNQTLWSEHAGGTWPKNRLVTKC